MEKVKFEEEIYVASKKATKFIEGSEDAHYDEWARQEWREGLWDDNPEVHFCTIDCQDFKSNLLKRVKMAQRVLTELKSVSAGEFCTDEWLSYHLDTVLAQEATKKFLIKEGRKLYVFDLESRICYRNGCELEFFPRFSGKTIKIWSLYEE